MKDLKDKKNIQNTDGEKDIHPGVDIDKADKEKTTPHLIKEWTEELNNNPRNNGKII